jgi:hypothetical protein
VFIAQFNLLKAANYSGMDIKSQRPFEAKESPITVKPKEYYLQSAVKRYPHVNVFNERLARY